MRSGAAMRNDPSKVHITVRRASLTARYRLWAEADGDFGVALAQSNTLGGLRRNAARAIRRQWMMGFIEGTLGPKGARAPPEILWHSSTRRYARTAAMDLFEVRRRWRESERKVRRIERKLRRAGAYAREARLIAQGQVDPEKSRRTGRLEVAPWSP
jgi:hypothetical protein